jgi:hypothetical protein
MRGLLVASALLVSAGSAAAEAPADLSHKGQVQASVRIPIGLRAIATYDNMIYCGDTDPQAAFNFASVCTGRAPFSLDFELGYGVGRQIDLILELRVGLESDFGVSPTAAAGPRMFHVSPGARFFFSEGGRTKLFTTAQLVIDLAGYEDDDGSGRGTDVGVRNLSGLWFDLARTYGVYVFVGETASFARWMRFELEGGIGVSGRYR